MGHTFFKNLKNGEKEIVVSYLIDISEKPKQLMGPNELLRMKADSAAKPSPKPSTSQGIKNVILVNYRDGHKDGF